MQFKTVTNPHRLGTSSITFVMLKVMLCLLPGTAILMALFGWGVLTNLLVAVITALIAEAIIMVLRQRPIKRSLLDMSAVITAWLLAIALPAASPYWLVLIGTLFAIVFAKHLYGGLGQNPFNPAMVGYVVLLISFPVNMTQWPAAQPTQDALSINALNSTIQHVFELETNMQSNNVDGITQATVLDYSQTQLSQNNAINQFINEPIFGTLGAANWEWAALAFMLGGIALIAWRVMLWQAPLGLLLSLGLCAQLFHWINPAEHHTAWLHWFSGSTMLGAFFIITDPVSGCTSNRGRFIFGALVGLLVFVIRTWGGYPDGMAFAVLLANMCAPTIDYYTKTRVFGTRAIRKERA